MVVSKKRKLPFLMRVLLSRSSCNEIEVLLNKLSDADSNRITKDLLLDSFRISLVVSSDFAMRVYIAFFIALGVIDFLFDFVISRFGG